ncbi:MAG: hypothetical protein QGI86_21040 [Candidatus Poribacteria bacterium]|nr:hypothetical protein [Candidatus Poribacteria bacterium]
MQPSEQHQLVIQQLKLYRPARVDKALRQIKEAPEDEACWSFFGQPEKLLNSHQQGGFINQLNCFPSQLPACRAQKFDNQLAHLCRQALRQQGEEPELNLLQSLSILTKQPKNELRAEINSARSVDRQSVSIYVLLGGAEAGVAEMWVRKDRSDSSRPIQFVSQDYQYDQIAKLEQALEGVTTLCSSNNSFVVELRKTAIIPANSGQQESKVHIDGGSIGLPFAIAVYSLLTGCSIPQMVAATGVVECDGRITGVGDQHIETKLGKLKTYNRLAEPEIGLLIVPQVNKKHLDHYQLKQVQTRYFDHLKKLFQHNILIDHYADQVKALIQLPEPDEDQHDLSFYKDISQSTKDAIIFPIPFDSQAEIVAGYLAKLLAQNRQLAHQLGQPLPPMPIICQASQMRQNTQLNLRHLAKQCLKAKGWTEPKAEDRFQLVIHSATDNDQLQDLKQVVNSESNDKIIVVANDWHQLDAVMVK